MPAYVYLMLRFVGIPIALLGYLLYQLLVAKKSWKDVKADALYVLIFMVVCYGLYWFFTG